MLQCIKCPRRLYGLCLNVQKEKVMVTGNVDDEAKQLTMDNNVVESANSFMYLDAQIYANGESSVDIRRRIMITKNTTKLLDIIWKSHNISIKSKNMSWKL